MIVSENMIIHNTHFGKRLQAYLNRNEIPTPKTNISGHRILPRIVCAVFPTETHQQAMELYNSNLAQVASHNVAATADEQQSDMSEPSVSQPRRSGPDSETSIAADVPEQQKSNLPPEAQALIETMAQSFKDQMAAIQSQHQSFKDQMAATQSEHRKQFEDFKASMMRNITQIAEPPDIRPEQPQNVVNSNNPTDDLVTSLINALRSPGLLAHQSDSQTQSNVFSNDTSKFKVEKAIHQRFDKERFAGSFKDDWQSHIEDFNDICNSYEIPSIDRVTLLKHTIKNEARAFYNAHIRGRNTSWESFLRLFSDEFAHLSKKAVFSEELQTISFRSFVQENRPLDAVSYTHLTLPTILLV